MNKTRLKLAAQLLSTVTDASKMDIRQALHTATMVMEVEAELWIAEGGDTGIPYKVKCECGHYAVFHDDETDDHDCDICDCMKFVPDTKEKK